MATPHVVVAGAGPVGAMTAATLAERGVRVTLLEQASELPVELRASTFHPATLELLDRHGVVPRLIKRGLIARRFAYRERGVGVVADFDLHELGDDTRYPFRLQCEQFKLCQTLLDDFAHNDLVSVRFASELESVTDHGDATIVRLSNGDTIEADAVVGTDGASSAVRKSLGLAFPGMTYEDRYLVVSTTVDFAEHLDDLAYVNYISDPDEWLVLLRTVDLWRALFPVPEHESDDQALSDDSGERRLQGIVARPTPYDIAHRTIYRVHQRVADSFRVGRVLLAGDAAHINNPLGGMGMNGGVHDAVLLGAGLAAWLHGDIDDARLDHLATLRRDLAIDFVKRHTHQNAITLATPDANVRAAALDQMRERASKPELRRDYLRTASMLSALDTMQPELTELGLWPFD